MVELLFFRFRVTNSSLKNKSISRRVTNSMGRLSVSHFRVTKVKLINEKKSLNITVWMSVSSWKSIILLTFLRTSYNSMSWGCPGILKNRSGIDVVSNRWESIMSLFTGYTPLVPETFKFKNFETWFPATYNNGRAVKY